MAKKIFVKAESGMIVEKRGLMSDLHVEIENAGNGLVLIKVAENGFYSVVPEGTIIAIVKDGRNTTTESVCLPRGRVSRLLWAYGFTAATRNAFGTDGILEKLYDNRYDSEGRFIGCSGTCRFNFESENINVNVCHRLDGRYLRYWACLEKSVSDAEYKALKVALENNFHSFYRIVEKPVGDWDGDQGVLISC